MILGKQFLFTTFKVCNKVLIPSIINVHQNWNLKGMPMHFLDFIELLEGIILHKIQNSNLMEMLLNKLYIAFARSEQHNYEPIFLVI